MPSPSEEGEQDTGISHAETVDVAELFERLMAEVRRSGADPGAIAVGVADRQALRDEAERLWPVSADRSLRLRPGVRGGLGNPVKALLRKLMRWYVEPVADDQRSFNAVALWLVDALPGHVDRLEVGLGRVHRAEA